MEELREKPRCALGCIPATHISLAYLLGKEQNKLMRNGFAISTINCGHVNFHDNIFFLFLFNFQRRRRKQFPDQKELDPSSWQQMQYLLGAMQR